MKLKELLKHHNIVWPEGATHAVQDGDGEIKFASSSNIVLDDGIWLRGASVIHVAEVFDLPLASDWDTAIVAKQELTMKFDLEKALAGHPVKLRNGAKAFVRHHETELDALYPLLGYLEATDKYVTATWTADGHTYSNLGMESDGDIVGMWIEPAVFNHWDALEPKWKYIAADEGGDVCVFTDKPVKEETIWSNRREEFVGFMYATSIINLQYTDWEHSLVERPSKK